MARKPGQKAGCDLHVKRKTIVEPVFAQTNKARGLRRFWKRQNQQEAMAMGLG